MNISFALGPLIIFVGLFALSVLLSDRRTRLWTTRLLLTVGLGLAGLLVLLLVSHRGAPFLVDRNQDSQQLVPSQSFSAPQLVIPPPPAYLGFTTTEKKSGTASSSADKAVPAPMKSTADEQSKSIDHPGVPSRPDWINQPPSKQGDVYVIPIESGVFSDPAIREQMLDAKMVAAANRYIDEVLYRQGGVADAVAIEPEFMQNFVQSRTASAANDETFVRLALNQHFRDEIDHRYKQFLSLGRLWQLGIVAAAGTSLLGALYGYLRMTQPRSQIPAKPAEISV